MILVISHPDDDHAQAVLGHLRARGADAFLLDLSAFPRGVSLSLSYGSEGRAFALRTEEGSRVDLGDCHVVWWRRPRLSSSTPTMPMRLPAISKQCRCEFVQPIASCRALWSFASIMSAGTSSRRQTGGWTSASVTLSR